ncbi:glycosyltransferase [Treponema denticola]|uniref:glycosyltransferase n=1 Tax=Treponema denticola TaxID=158 RepID=UPI002108250C|nr:glycosyltransferase [Treponema denticola]UTY25860.1 glycosyltransferase [Treponema denticola]
MQDNFQPLVSIVIPVYNGSNYMREAIDSALAQTYPNIEVIVVNDGSTDNTDEIAKSYGNKIRYFSKENGGVSTALNHAIENMKGEYFSWLSHDDMYLPEKIESQINILKNLEDKTTVIYSGYKYIDEDNNILNEVRLEKLFALSELNKPLFSLFYEQLSGCTLLVHVSHFQRVGGFDTSLKTTQDYDLWFRILRNGTIHYDINCNTLSRLHHNQETITNSQHEKNCCELWIHLVDSISESEIKTSFSSEYNFLAEVYYVFLQFGYYENFLLHIKAKFNDFCIKNDIKTRETILLNKLFEAKMRLKSITIVSLFNEQITKSKILTFFLRVYLKLIRVFTRIIRL